MRRAATLVLFWLLLPQGVASAAPNDPGFSQQWNLTRIRADRAWARSKGAGIIVAVVDTGVDRGHPDLAGRLVGGYDFEGDDPEDPNDFDSDPQDENGHGTFMAGIISAATGNGIGVASVAPSARIMPVRALNADGVGDPDLVARGIRWAVSHGADVINLSLAETSDGGARLPDAFFASSDLRGAIRDAARANRFVAIAAGNDFGAGGTDATSYDSTDPRVVVVGASTSGDRRAAYSNFGLGLDVLAPGGGSASSPSACDKSSPVISTWWEAGGYQYGQGCGTSMGVAHVSGVAALLMARGHSASGAASRILGTAKDLGSPGRDDSTGYGRVDAYAAVGAGSSSSPQQSQSPRPRSTPKKKVSTAASPTAAPSVKESTIVPSPTTGPTDGILAGADLGDGPTEPRRALVVVATALALMVGLAHPIARTRFRGR